jgi:hypothetical protein
MELFNKALFLSQQKIFALTHRRVYTLMVNLFQILNQFVLLFRKNVTEKSSMIWRVFHWLKLTQLFQKHPVCTILAKREIPKEVNSYASGHPNPDIWFRN